MSPPLLSGAGSDPRASLQRLALARWWLLGGLAAALLVLAPLLGIPVAVSAPLAVLAALAGLNLDLLRRLRPPATVAPGALPLQLLADIIAVTGVLALCGGVTNPLVSLLLPPVAFAALTLPPRQVAAIGGAALLAYSLLLFFYVPLPIGDAARATHLHLVGMWLTFGVSAALIAWFALVMTRRIRERDAELAAAREQALRDERVVALGTLAAGTAHELGTPLNTIAVLASDLMGELPKDHPLRDDIDLIRSQVAACRDIVTRLSQRADAERLGAVRRVPADAWLAGVRTRWHAARPDAASRLDILSAGPAPGVPADPRLEQALTNLLNNAANAAPGRDIALSLAWSGGTLDIRVTDTGPGFPAGVLAADGRTACPAHDGGQGVGLMLTRAAVEQLGGTLSLGNLPGGGADAHIRLPVQP